MGVDITVKVIRRKHTGDSTMFVDKSFFRQLKPEENFSYDDEMAKEVTHIRFGYMYYNSLRAEIATHFTGHMPEVIWSKCEKLQAHEPYPCPLYHLINFSDCEGYIGPSAVSEMAAYLRERSHEGLSPHAKSIVGLILTAAEHQAYIIFH